MSMISNIRRGGAVRLTGNMTYHKPPPGLLGSQNISSGTTGGDGPKGSGVLSGLLSKIGLGKRRGRGVPAAEGGRRRGRGVPAPEGGRRRGRGVPAPEGGRRKGGWLMPAAMLASSILPSIFSKIFPDKGSGMKRCGGRRRGRGAIGQGGRRRRGGAAGVYYG